MVQQLGFSFLVFLSASALSVPDYCSILSYSDLYQTVLNHFRTVLGTHTLNPATCFWYSHRTRAGSGALEPCSRQGGSCPGWEKAQPADSRDVAARHYRFLPLQLPGWQPGVQTDPCGRRTPGTLAGITPGWPLERGGEGDRPSTLARLFSSARVCGCQLRCP